MANSFLDIFLGWILLVHPALGIIIISFIASLLVTLVVKYLSNQTLMKDLRNELKELQKEMKELKNNPTKLAKINERFMETNMKYMSHSMKPTLYTFIPIILIFGWLNSHLGYYPLLPNQPYEVTAYFEKGITGEMTLSPPQNSELLTESSQEIINQKASWILRSDQGQYDLVFYLNNSTYIKEVIITEEREYAPVEKSFRQGFIFKSVDTNGLDKIVLSNEKITPFADVPVIKDLPWVGSWGWLGVYFLFSIIFSMALRRIFNVY